MPTELHVTGMTCGGCEESVETALSDVAGVEDVRADEGTDTVTVEGDADPLDLIAAVPEPYEADAA
ncbi:heavy-metal-associated domain-containing protein [Halorarum salinum]|uniref:Cation transporter n=1 Tax=Halorarum salinum TaxID=2743089 RepID=A0A7D5LAP5_9EURY|nr:heavy-metal-associated domain-containing protein [Halobaculum salinum]QLG61635.1 cation transporter [Halobaculum salinum]